MIKCQFVSNKPFIYIRKILVQIKFNIFHVVTEMKRRAGLYVSMNRTRSDLAVVMVVALFGKSASFG